MLPLNTIIREECSLDSRCTLHDLQHMYTWSWPLCINTCMHMYDCLQVVPPWRQPHEGMQHAAYLTASPAASLTASVNATHIPTRFVCVQWNSQSEYRDVAHWCIDGGPLEWANVILHAALAIQPAGMMPTAWRCWESWADCAQYIFSCHAPNADGASYGHSASNERDMVLTGTAQSGTPLRSCKSSDSCVFCMSSYNLMM